MAAFVTLDGVFPGWDDLRGSLAAESSDTVESVPTVTCEDWGVVAF